jgi:O-antigen ligase
MVLIIVTDPQPLAALRRLYSGLGFILFPLSVVMIRYTTLGREWTNDGFLMVTGITTNKNMLGLIAFVISLGALWNFRWLLINRSQPHRSRRIIAQGILLMFGLSVLHISHSSTSLACFLLGGGLMLATHLRAIKQQPSRVHVLCLALVVLGGSFALLGGTADVALALGRQPTLSGRTFMWTAMLGAVSNPIIGVGFDSFWTSPEAETFHHNLSLLHWYHPDQINEAHNGYLEVYLNLGWIGVCLIAIILITGYVRASKALRRDHELGSLMLANIIAGAVYSITEAGFRTLNPVWIFILLAVISASGANVGLFGTKQRAVRYYSERRVTSTRRQRATV